jgi:DNA-binding NarL/FixJ family response regulator
MKWGPEMREGAVLVVEDDPIASQAVSAMLRESSDQLVVLSADCVADAQNLLGEASVCCVFLDLGLPDSGGLEGLRQLAAAAPAVPIIVLTATDDEFLAAQALHEGAREYIPKSAATAGLLGQLLDEALDVGGAPEA